MSYDDNYQILTELVAAQQTGESVVLATIVKARGSVPRHAGTKMLIYADGRLTGTIGGGEMESRIIQEATTVMQAGQPHVYAYTLVEPKQGDPGVCGGEVEIYLEPYMSPATFFIIGCGHVGRAVAHLAYWLGYQVVVTDDRPELVTPELIPNAHHYLPGSIEEALAAHPITNNCYIALLTRNVLIDRQIIPHLLETPAPYIGIIGSRRRWLETKKLLIADGYHEGQLTQFHSPIGLELNAETPEEIAVSILSEVIMLRRGGTGKRMGLQFVETPD